jgi:hypothetical protein
VALKLTSKTYARGDISQLARFTGASPGDLARSGAIRMEALMLDLILLLLAFGFFALTIGYAYACERL